MYNRPVSVVVTNVALRYTIVGSTLHQSKFFYSEVIQSNIAYDHQRLLYSCVLSSEITIFLSAICCLFKIYRHLRITMILFAFLILLFKTLRNLHIIFYYEKYT